MPRIAGHRMRFFRRNFRRMYPEAVKRMERRQRLQLALRGCARLLVAGAAVATAGAAWWGVMHLIVHR